MSKLRTKIRNNEEYVEKQIALFLKKYYRLSVKLTVRTTRELKKRRMYSATVFPSHVHGEVSVEMEYGLMTKGRKQDILETAFREAVRIGLWRTGRPYVNNHPVFEKELKKYNLKSYGGVPEMGRELHTYSCKACKSIWGLKERKLPKSRDPSELGLKTKCCRDVFEYGGKIYYTNEQLQKVKRSIERRG